MLSFCHSGAESSGGLCRPRPPNASNELTRFTGGGRTALRLLVLALDGFGHRTFEYFERPAGALEVTFRICTDNYGRELALRFYRAALINPAPGTIQVLESKRNVTDLLRKAIKRETGTPARVVFDGL